MWKVLIILMFAYIHVLSDYLVVADSPIGTATNTISLNNMGQRFPSNSLLVGANSVSLSIPIYVKSDSMKAVNMVFYNLSNLKNLLDNQEILTSFFYKQYTNNIETPIYNNTAFTLLSDGMGSRDGNSPVGYIIIRANSISDIQTSGEYQLSTNTQVSLANENSNIANFSVYGDVPLVAIASFNPVSSYQSGQKFDDAYVEFGKLDFLTENIKLRDLYVKSNSNQNFKVTLTPSDLIHQVYPDHVIKMNYYYRPNNSQEVYINSSNYFTAIHGKNDGRKVGELKFETEQITGLHLAGEYKATMQVTVTLE